MTSLLARATRPLKNIDQRAEGEYPGGVYVRLDDRSTWTSALLQAGTDGLGISTVYACVRVLAESVASLPLILYRRLENGGKERATDHPLYDLFHDQANPDMTSFIWREVLMTHLTTWGDGFNEKTVRNDGTLAELWPIRPDRMKVDYGGRGGSKRYTYVSPDGEEKVMDPALVFHVKGLSANGLHGMSPIELHRRTFRLAETALTYGTNFLENGARPATVLSHPGNLSDPAIKRLAGQMDDLRGSKNSGKTVILEEGLTVTEVGVPPEDAQYIETRKFQRNVIASEIFRIPPHKIGDLEHATFTNIEHQSIEFVTDSLRPWLVRIEQEVKTQLLQDEDDLFVEFLIDGLLRGDAKARSEALAIQRQNGAINGDEWREIENRNPIDDGSGKTFWMPVNYQPAALPEEDQPPEAPETPQEAPGAPPLDFTAIGAPGLPEVASVAPGRSAEVRCADCHRLLAEQATPPYRITCSRCKAVAAA